MKWARAKPEVMVEILLLLTAFVATVLVVTVAAGRFGLQAPLLLLVVGMVGSLIPVVHVPALPPELVLVGLLPPLLYSAAVNTSLIDFRANVASIGWLSIGLVLATTVGVGVVMWWLLPVPLPAAFALGAIVAPPDAVAATAVARQIGLPRKVVTLLEGESLVNDATALVSLRTAVAALVAPVSVAAIAFDFATSVIIALVIGWAVARVALLVFARLTDDSVTTTVLTFLVPFAAYAPAEEAHASGVLAVVVAGLLVGHRSPVAQSASGRLFQRRNWATVQYLLENSVFLLVGLQVRRIVADASGTLPLPVLIWSCLGCLGAMIVLRVAWVALTRLWLTPRRGRRTPRLSWGESFIVGWAGMRGVVTLAAALSLPEITPHRSALVLVALAVTVGTLLLQGLTLPRFARRMGVRGPDPREDALQEAAVYQRVVAGGMARAEEVAGPDDGPALDRLRDGYDTRLNSIWERLGRPTEETYTPSTAYRRLRMAALEAERTELLRIRDSGSAEHEVVARVLASLDTEEVMLTVAQDHYRRAEENTGQTLTATVRQDPCEELAIAPRCVRPDSVEGCSDCVREHTVTVHLRMCLTCGHVGCCDSSPARHADRHFRETRHPVIRSFEPGESWRWCYLHSQLGE